MKKQIKIFVNFNCHELEDEMNAFLQTLTDTQVVNIISSSSGAAFEYAVVYYTSPETTKP